jgi:hypothetical protein
MGVYQDYMDHQWGRYFTENFRTKHLRPFHYIPLGGHQEARRRAREGNVSLGERFQRGQDTSWNSIIFDIDPSGDVPRQVLQLMKEIEKRNLDGYYDGEDVDADDVLTMGAYYIQTTGHGSRQRFVHAAFRYGVSDDGSGRFIVNHYGGTI